MSGTATPLLSLMVLSLLALSSFLVLVARPVSADVGSISNVRSGLITRDPLTTGDTHPWMFYGDAVKFHAPYTYHEDSRGLHIGVRAADGGHWAGYFAKSLNTHAMVFHATLSFSNSSISSNIFDSGLYVQTYSRVSYVTCAARVDNTGFGWVVLYTSGSTESALTFHRVYIQRGGPMTRDCTIVTNGMNLLKVYLDGRLVYFSDSLDLQMPQPFNSYLEVQSTDASAMLFGTYTDYYETANEAVALQDAPPGGMAEIVGSSGDIIASSVVGEDGSAMINIGGYKMPIEGRIQLYNAGHELLATSETADIWGGDIYQASTMSPPSTTSSSTQASVSTSTASSSSTFTSSENRTTTPPPSMRSTTTSVSIVSRAETNSTSSVMQAQKLDSQQLRTNTAPLDYWRTFVSVVAIASLAVAGFVSRKTVLRRS